MFSELQKELLQNATKNEQTLVYFYYSGHGIQRNQLFALCNEEKVYPLEKMLWSLASTDKSFVTALMDCSRTEYKASFKGFNQVDA